VALRLVAAATRAAATGSTAAGSPPSGFDTVSEAAQGRAQYGANRKRSRLHWPITGPVAMLVLGLPR